MSFMKGLRDFIRGCKWYWLLSGYRWILGKCGCFGKKVAAFTVKNVVKICGEKLAEKKLKKIKKRACIFF